MNERPDEIMTDKHLKRSRYSGFWIEVVKFVLITLIVVVPVRIFIAQPFIVFGASMDPAFEDGEYLIVDQISFRFEPPERESVVIFRYPVDQTKFFIKRVIGLPGETVKIRNGEITIENSDNPEGFALTENYILEKNFKLEDFDISLGNDEYFVMGDNRLGSFDSRAWGPVSKKLIIGRPLFRLLPINRINVLPGDFSNN